MDPPVQIWYHHLGTPNSKPHLSEPETKMDHPSGRCMLLELPAELRLRIYEYALAPTGTLSLTRTRSKRFATDPLLGPGLLRTNRQINAEASPILYSENTISITVDAHDTCWPTISESRLPQRVLEKLEHVSVVLDLTNNFHAHYSDVDWTAFSALVSLRSMRIAVLALMEGDSYILPRDCHASINELLADLLPEIFERIPVETRLTYGTVEGIEERAMSDRALAIRSNGMKGQCMVREVPAVELMEMAEEVRRNVEQGCKSGGVKDVFAEYRNIC